MPGYAKAGGAKANIVKDSFPLPGTWVYQDITINYSFQGFPTLSVKTEGIVEEDFQSVKDAFDLATNVTFKDIDFEVTQIGWSRQLFVHVDNEINIYSISANFDPVIKRKLETGIKVKRLGGTTSYATGKKKKKKPKNKDKPKISIQKLCGLVGVGYSGPEALIPIPEDKEELMVPASIIPEVAKSKGCIVVYGKGVKLIKWNAPTSSHVIARTDLIEDGENTETFPPVYQGVELTWDREDEEPNEEEEDKGNEPDDRDEKQQLPPRYDFVRVQTKIQTLTEEDVRYSEPPPDTKVLKGLDSLSWESGPTRRHQVTTLYDGVEMKSYFEIWGFVYQAYEILKDDGHLFSSEPAKFWQRVEVQNTSKIYEQLGLINLKVNGINKLNKKDVRLVVHPDYANFGKISSFAMEGYLFSFQPRVEYLTGTVTTGWKVMPLERESSKPLGDILEPEENPRAKVQIPLAIPRTDRTAYRLSPARLYYKDEEQNQSLPFQLDFKPFSELEPYVQDVVRWQIDIKPMTPDSLIGVIVPEINYVEPLVVLTESRTTNSFAYAADPESTDEDPKPPLVAGEEGFFRLDRTILEKDKYRESITEYTATDPGYRASLTISRTSEKSGQAPQGESKPIKYDKKERDDWWEKRYQGQYKLYDPNSKKQQKVRPLPRYYVNSDLIGEGNPTGGNLSFPYAKSLGEALAAAKTSLEIEHCTSSGQQQKKIAWYIPGIRDSDRVMVDGKTFRVLSASVTVSQVGNNVKPIPGLVQLTEGTSVTLGPEVPRSVESYRVKDELDDPMDEPMNPDQGSAPAGDGEAQVKFIGGTSELGDVLEPDATRRKF